ncbi:hypothetical protein V5799_033550 [Amblyomma americanum]|uniref:Uncharacterized protein n=1 Tax=Amblyomma americanum TaxID=6943 RepID=A0AAQ4DN01_AMBAM
MTSTYSSGRREVPGNNGCRLSLSAPSQSFDCAQTSHIFYQRRFGAATTAAGAATARVSFLGVLRRFAAGCDNKTLSTNQRPTLVVLRRPKR